MTGDQDRARAAGSAVSRAARRGSDGDGDGGHAQPGDAHGHEASPLTVLVDDTREFLDGRRRRVARSSATGVALLTELRETCIDDLWLDHDLGGDDDIWPVLRLLEDAHLRGKPFDIGLVHIQASRSGPSHCMGISLRRAEYKVERSYDLRMWTRWDGRPDRVSSQ